MRINAGGVVAVRGIRVQPRASPSYYTNQYVTAFTVQHSVDDSTWIDVDGGATFTGASGNFDAHFAAPVMAQYIRITVVTWNGDHISMRAGLLSGGPVPSIALDFGTAIQVAYVAVYNRRDCCQGRLGDYTVSYRVSSSDTWTVCARENAAADAYGPLLSECSYMARYVMIQLPGSKPYRNGDFGRVLNLAEVEVYSFPPPSPPSTPGLIVTSELTLDTDASPDGFTYSSVVIAAGATLKATGKNPLIINVESSIDIQGTIDLSGGKGGNSAGDHKAAGGGAGGGNE